MGDLDLDTSNREKRGGKNSFIFSLNKQKKYTYNSGNEIYCYESYSLVFGNDIYISNNWDHLSGSNFPGNYGKNENATKNEIAPLKFKPIEVEVFSIKRKN